MKAVLLATLLLLVPAAQAAPLPPATLSGEATAEGTLLTWTLPGPADVIHLHALQADGGIQTVDIAGDLTGYVMPPDAGTAFTMTYTNDNGTSLPSNPVPGYPYTCQEYFAPGSTAPMQPREKCFCPEPPTGLVCAATGFVWS